MEQQVIIPTDYKPREFVRTAMNYVNRDKIHIVDNSSDKSTVYFTCDFDISILGENNYNIKIEHGVSVSNIVEYLKQGFRHDVDNLYLRQGLSDRLKVDFSYSEDMSCNWKFKTGDTLIIMNKRLAHNNRESCFTIITFNKVSKI